MKASQWDEMQCLPIQVWGFLLQLFSHNIPFFPTHCKCRLSTWAFGLSGQMLFLALVLSRNRQCSLLNSCPNLGSVDSICGQSFYLAPLAAVKLPYGTLQPCRCSAAQYVIHSCRQCGETATATGPSKLRQLKVNVI